MKMYFFIIVLKIVIWTFVAMAFPSEKVFVKNPNLLNFTTGQEVNNTNVESVDNFQSLQKDLTGSGREEHWEKYAVPAFLGLKLTGLAFATFAILKLFVLQALLVSKTALWGAILLALKAAYDHLRHKFWHSKHTHVESYPYGTLPQWDWWTNYYPHHFSPDYLSQGQPTSSEHARVSFPLHMPVALPHAHLNETFAVRSDGIKLTTASPNLLRYKNYITKITETFYD